MADPNPQSKIRSPTAGLPRQRDAKTGVVVPHKAKWHQRLAAGLIYAFIRCVGATIRFKLDDRSGLFADGPKEKFIFAIWHSRLALCLVIYRRYVARPAPEHRMAAMVSASKDGGLLARILELLASNRSAARPRAAVPRHCVS